MDPKAKVPVRVVAWIGTFIVLSSFLILGLAGTAGATAVRLASGAAVVVCDEVGGITFITPGVVVGACFSLGSGHVTFGGSVGVFAINVTTGLSYSSLGSPSFAMLDLSDVSTSGPAGTINIRGTQTGFTGPSPATYQFSAGGTTGPGGSVTFNSYFDPGNAQFGTTNLIGSLGPFGGAFAGSVLGAVNAPGLFSMTIEGIVTHTSATGVTSFNAELRPQVAEPGARSLLGLGLLGLLLVGSTEAALRRKFLVSAL